MIVTLEIFDEATKTTVTGKVTKELIDDIASNNKSVLDEIYKQLLEEIKIQIKEKKYGKN